jgi:hypothetical protein
MLMHDSYIYLESENVLFLNVAYLEIKYSEDVINRGKHEWT